MTTRKGSQADGLGGALAIHFTVYVCVFGLCAVGLYLLMQPATRPNPGLAAYAPPPATVLGYEPPGRLFARTPPKERVAAVEPEPEPSTDGRGAQEAEMKPDDGQSPKLKPQKAKSRPARPRSPVRDYTSYSAYGGYPISRQRLPYASYPVYGGFRPF